jgi:NADH-quinone oxidoreductase subunit H
MDTLARIIVEKYGVPAAWELAVLVALYLVYAVFALAFGGIFAGVTSWYERRVAGRMQSRIGPNCVGPQGVLQWLADGLKNWLKEDLIPTDADSILYRIAPYLVFTGVLGTFVVLPFSPTVVGLDLNIGIVYLIAITSLVVVGILMAGWSSASKWTLLGGVRSAAQMISYEIPVALSLLVAVIPVGSLSLQAIIRAQGGEPWNWMVFHDPVAFLAFGVYFISSLAEGNRTPFDLPEAESELVAGFNTEYSGMRFLFFFFAEWMNLYVIAAVVTAVFLGGWRLPFIPLDRQTGNILLEVGGAAFFLVKALALVNIIIWVRWTLPRLRIDQLMRVCWTYFVPFGLAGIVLSMGFLVLIERFPQVGEVTRYVLCGVGVCITFLMLLRAAMSIRKFPEKPYFRWLI